MADDTLTLAFPLEGQPSAFHTAGLAGLSLLCDTLAPAQGLVAMERSPAGATLQVDAAGLSALLDAFFAVSEGEMVVFAPRKDADGKEVEPRWTKPLLDPAVEKVVRQLEARLVKDPEVPAPDPGVKLPKGVGVHLCGAERLFREADRLMLSLPKDKAPAAKGKGRGAPSEGGETTCTEETLRAALVAIQADERLQKTAYAYPLVLPRGAILADLEPAGPGRWLKLWQDMVWQVLRVPKARLPYERRAGGGAPGEGAALFKDLATDALGPLSQSLCPDVQGQDREGTPLRDGARSRFLLLFWPLVSFVFRLRVDRRRRADQDAGQRRPDSDGFVLAVPDIRDLSAFCAAYPAAMRRRDPTLLGLYPKQSLLDLPEEAALRIHALLPAADLGVLRWEVRHLDKPGANAAPRLRRALALEVPAAAHQAAYAKLRFDPRDPEAHLRDICALAGGSMPPSQDRAALLVRRVVHGFLYQKLNEQGFAAKRRELAKALYGELAPWPLHEMPSFAQALRAPDEAGLVLPAARHQPAVLKERFLQSLHAQQGDAKRLPSEADFEDALERAVHVMVWRHLYAVLEEDEGFKAKRQAIIRAVWIGGKNKRGEPFARWFARTFFSERRPLSAADFETLAASLRTENATTNTKLALGT